MVCPPWDAHSHIGDARQTKHQAFLTPLTEVDVGAPTQLLALNTSEQMPADSINISVPGDGFATRNHFVARPSYKSLGFNPLRPSSPQSMIRAGMLINRLPCLPLR